MDDEVTQTLNESGQYVELTDVRDELVRLAGEGTTEEIMTALKRESREPPIGAYSPREVRELIEEKEDFAVRMMEAATSEETVDEVKEALDDA